MKNNYQMETSGMKRVSACSEKKFYTKFEEKVRNCLNANQNTVLQVATVKLELHVQQQANMTASRRTVKVILTLGSFESWKMRYRTIF